MVRRRSLALLLWVAAAGGIFAQQARLSFSPQEWDFGTIPATGPIGLTLDVRNTGGAAAEVTMIPTCDCLSVEPSTIQVAAGSQAAFRLRYDPSEDNGDVRKDYVIRTSVQGLEKALFTVRGTVAGKPTEPGPSGTAETAGPKLHVTYFYTSGCAKCERFLDGTVPEVGRRIGARIVVERRDILDSAEYARYASIIAGLKTEIRAFPALLVGRTLLQGDGEIAAGFESAAAKLAATDAATDASTDATSGAAAAASSGAAAVAASGADGVAAGMAVLPVLLGGLLDGINPCAFTTLIFLLSYLSLAGKGRREILLIGVLFTFAVFLTYLLVGLGFFKALRAASAYPLVAKVLRWVLVAALGVLAAFSVYDFTLIRRGKASEMVLQLPSALKRRIHASIRTTAKTAAIAGSSLVLGFLVSLFEFACTGQVYLPTLAYLVRIRREASALLLLVLYNLCFVLPLLLVFTAVHLGVGSQRISVFFQRHMGAVKLGLAVFFLGMAVFTLAV